AAGKNGSGDKSGRKTGTHHCLPIQCVSRNCGTDIGGRRSINETLRRGRSAVAAGRSLPRVLTIAFAAPPQNP
ncbi:MAG: hypothetical protein ACREFH_12460, partial [Stellaceae bacterium]